MVRSWRCSVDGCERPTILPDARRNDASAWRCPCFDAGTIGRAPKSADDTSLDREYRGRQTTGTGAHLRGHRERFNDETGGSCGRFGCRRHGARTRAATGERSRREDCEGTHGKNLGVEEAKEIYMSVARARQRAKQLVEQLGIAKEHSHVDVEEAAKKLSLAVVRSRLGDDISGMLVTKGGETTICINKDQHANRQRFTIAHEIGHHVLRHLLAGEHVHVDRVILRSAASSEGTDLREIEAHQFAACLLMPEHMVHHHLQALKSQYVEDVVRQLAKQLKVSQ